jgi:glutamine cyclotransferase
MIREMSFKKVLIILLLSIGILFIQCGENKSTNKSPRIKKVTKVISPKNGIKITTGLPVKFEVVSSQDTVEIDHFTVSLGTKLVYTSNSENPQQFTFERTGRQNLSYTVYLSNGKKEHHSQFITALSDIKPVRYTYRKVNSYTHDPDAYTQGLFFDDGMLLESTGHKGESSLRKVDIASGNVIQKIDLEEAYFGEGITLFGNEIFMLTWKSQKGFVFDKTDFTKVREFTYPTEGWGLTTMGDTLVMTDETEKIYFMEPSTFTQIDKIEVYDQNGPIDALNELEFINGEIYANIYQTDEIAIIDPKTGKVTGIINLEGIFNKQNYDRRLDVLNGIAYDSKSDRLFVTGKFYPKLYEIELIPLEEPSI